MDYIFRAIARENKIRVIGIDAKESVEKICKAQATLPLTTMAFARFLLAGAMIGVLEKGNNGITMQINSDGPVKMLFMQATSNGLIRGYVSNPTGDLELDENKLSIENVIGNNGILSVTKTIDAEHNFTSDVILTESNITQDIAYYFFASEQIPTILNLQVSLDDEGYVSEAKGYLIQLLTGYEEEDVVFLEGLKLDKIKDLKEDMVNMFSDFQLLEEIKVKDICDCSKEKFLTGIASLSNEDLKELAQDDIEVVCQFCSKVYKYSKEDIENIIKEKNKTIGA